MTRRRCLKTVLAVAIGLLIGIIILVVGLYLHFRPRPNHNQLAIGGRGTVETLAIPIVPPAELDFMSRDAVLDLRRAAVARHPELMASDYEPSDVFRWIADDRPWWGMAGQFYYGSGAMSITGPAEESRFILNPFLLVHPEFYGFSFYYYGRLVWDEDRMTDAVLSDPDFPWACPPHDLRWQPIAARAEVHYDITGCLAQINRYTVVPLDLSDANFGLTAYNARDLNLTWIWVDYAASTNIARDGHPDSAYQNPQYLHKGGSCGYEGGCNNMSPSTPPIQDMYLEGLPAQAVVKLWRDAPDTVNAAADMTFTIGFE